MEGATGRRRKKIRKSRRREFGDEETVWELYPESFLRPGRFSFKTGALAPHDSEQRKTKLKKGSSCRTVEDPLYSVANHLHAQTGERLKRGRLETQLKEEYSTAAAQFIARLHTASQGEDEGEVKKGSSCRTVEDLLYSVANHLHAQTGGRLKRGRLETQLREEFRKWDHSGKRRSMKPGETKDGLINQHSNGPGCYTVLPEYYIPIVMQYLQMTNDELRTTAESGITSGCTSTHSSPSGPPSRAPSCALGCTCGPSVSHASLFQTIHTVYQPDANGPAYLFTELLDGDMAGWLRKERAKAQTLGLQGIKVDTVLDKGRGILDGLRHMHIKKVAHLDLKKENILMTTTGAPKIGDFGLFWLFDPPDPQHPTVVVSLLLRPPELLGGNNSYGLIADEWSVGVMFVEALSGKYPFAGKAKADDEQGQFEVLCDIVKKINCPQHYRHTLNSMPLVQKFASQGQYLPFGNFTDTAAELTAIANLIGRPDIKANDPIVKLIHRLLQIDPARRVTAEQGLTPARMGTGWRNYLRNGGGARPLRHSRRRDSAAAATPHT
ncbi:unnamed protein product [Vitrella brassicaformis CCMP3155]|uniref:Cyclin-dependent kinase 2 homolog n=1 Tax=Vitrella brassicaformis (strain CCMP3155) TaxID=1169540 RepID=A0A0G4G7B7_VITBC|nr:unnamed protein product [Vitrella brassicaformis CCMP3155]|eukprot:CEM24557.1 unnamed protein product [Vitrella brassicaformis CCMP3155]